MDDDRTQATLTFGVGGTISNRYEIRGLLGEGGMGAVYRVRDRELDEEVALKVLRPELAATPDSLVRFRREVKLARRVTHPNVARTYDLGAHDGVRYLTMELIDGERLRAPITIGELLRVGGEIASGLAAAHAAGVVHRDLKPDNILIAGERVVITDFGIAHADNLADALRTTGGVVGTPAYIAPEQLEGASVDGRTDIYALGVVLYELIAGRLPFDGDSTTALALARLTRPPTPLPAGAVPEAVAKLIMDALARRKDDRPDAHTFAARLARLRGGAAPQVTTSALAIPLGTTARTLRIATPDADPATGALAADLATAIGDALVERRDLEVVRDGRADLALELTVRAAGDRVRVRSRLVDERGAVWADRAEGTLADPFALEDAVAVQVAGAVRARIAGGPPPELRARYDTAKLSITGDPATIARAIAQLEQLHVEHPIDPWIASLLACGLVRVAVMRGADDPVGFARAEELALRALERDPSNGQACFALASIRSARGEHVESMAAAHEALRRAPRLGAAHALVGRVLCWLGRVAEGLQRLELACQLDPDNGDPFDYKLCVRALVGGDSAGLRTELRELDRLPMAAVLARLRLVPWWRDRELAREASAMMGDNPGGAWQTARPVLDAYASGDTARVLPGLTAALDQLTSERVLPRHRSMMCEIATDLYVLFGDRERALAMVGRLARMTGFLDLLWLDRAPTLDELRDTPEFAHARAMTAERAARVSEAIG